jgi:Ribbon-helix-helix protein, copG family
MAKKSTGRPVGRPVGTRTATVELETLSFKVPAEFKAQLQAYAKQRRQSISELIREGVEWRIGEGDPLNIRYGTVTSDETAYERITGNTEKIEKGVEFLHGMLSALVAEVRQLHTFVQAIAQRLGEPGSMHAPSVTGNTDFGSVDGDIPAASMEAQSTLAQTLAVEDTRESIPPYDPAKRTLGKLCRGKHEWGNTGQTLLRLPNLTCPVCEAASKREKRKARREMPPVSG